MKLKSRPLIGFLALTAALGLTVTSVAQSRLSIGGNESNFGSRALSGGFTPDPHEVSVVAGGSLQASNMGLGAGCTGAQRERAQEILHFLVVAAHVSFPCCCW